MQGGRGGREVAGALEGQAEGQVRLGKIGAEADRGAIRLGGLGEAILLEEHGAQIGVCRDDVGRTHQRLAQQHLGLARPAQPAQHAGQLDRDPSVGGPPP